VPREYQTEAHDGCFRLWGEGVPGVLMRLFTGGGKTLTACLAADTWLRRGENYRVMVVSYETQLVSQFAEEIEDYLGIHPGIEMDTDSVDPWHIPQITVASRQSLLRKPEPTPEQIEELASHGIKDLGACSKPVAETYLKHLRKGGDLEGVRDDLSEKNAAPEAADGFWSRLHKFDWRLNWLVIFDEAHRHPHGLRSVGHIVNWFERNPASRRLGLTATPKRGDGVSIGDKMFPGIAIDYPLFSPVKPSAVKDGYAVPYVQKYIEVEGVDFKQIKRLKSDGDFEDAALEQALGQEETLAKLVGPLLDMVGDRRTLIFSPGVEMAKNVARFINARSQARCQCGLVKWYPNALIGDGAACSCGRFIEAVQVTKSGDQAKELDGESPARERKEVYRAHQQGEFQFLSVCGLCREGYNDPDIACVAVFRPVGKKASSLAEQMKGRACRPLRSVAQILHTLPDAEARCKAIAESAKPNALIVDLVGITGLADCASTVQVYADGLPDEVRERAEEIVAKRGLVEEVDVEGAIEQAKREDEEERERIRQEREAAERKAREEYERRSEADAQVRYTTHDVGYGAAFNATEASEKQIKYVGFLGMELERVILSKKRASQIISQLKCRQPLEEIAQLNGLRPEQWKPKGPSPQQCRLMASKGLPTKRAKSKYDASLLLEAKLNPDAFQAKKVDELRSAKSSEELDAVAMDLRLVRGVLPEDKWNPLVSAGKEIRHKMNDRGDAWEN
jgi:superfamily II DNA or RNA helicase